MFEQMFNGNSLSVLPQFHIPPTLSRTFEYILDLKSLELRRLRFDLIQYYKILNNLIPQNYAKYFTYHQPSSSSRKPSPFLIKPINNPNYLLSSFFNRSVDCWNSLRQTLKEVNYLLRLGKTCLWLTCLPF